MPKKTNLAEAFKVDANELQPKTELEIVEPEPTETKPTGKKPKATGQDKPKKKHIGGYFPPDVYKQMKILCAEKGMTTQEILTEGLNAVFRMHDKPPIA